MRIDFVIMGTLALPGWEAFFIGTNAGAVMSGITSLLCVPPEVDPKNKYFLGFYDLFVT
jgi:hypothetical protein